MRESERLLRKHARQEVREGRQSMRQSAKTYKTGAKLYSKGERQYYGSMASQANKSGGSKKNNRWKGGPSKASRYRELDARAYMKAGSEMMEASAPRKKVYGVTRRPSWGGRKLKR